MKHLVGSGMFILLNSATNILREYLTLFELTEVMRQKDDKQFAELLNHLREGKHQRRYSYFETKTFEYNTRK